MSALDPHVRTWPCPTVAAASSSGVHDGGVAMRPYAGVGELQLLRTIRDGGLHAEIRFSTWGIEILGPAAAEAAAAIEAAGLAQVTP